MNFRNYNKETQCVHTGIYDDENGAVVPPIYQTSTFRFKSSDHGAALFAGRENGYIYSRMLNPTVKSLEDAVSELEEGHKGLGTASGMAAIHTVLGAYLKTGDHVIVGSAVYGPTQSLLNKVMIRYGIELTTVDSSNLEEIKQSLLPQTKMIFIETPGNPTLVVSDIAAIAQLAKERNILFIVDNTFNSPVLQQPIKLGADIVVHSMTKFLNGHADVVAGMIVVSTEEQYQRLRYHLNHFGGIIPPMEAFLVLRGIRTLSLRMERHCTNAMTVAEYLQNHSAVSWVSYPGLKSHPGHEISKKQSSGFGGMVSFELKGGLKAGKHMMNSVKLCQLAVSLGGVESLIQHPASMTHAGMSKEARIKGGISDGLVRFSVGIENVSDIIADLQNAMKGI